MSQSSIARFGADETINSGQVFCWEKHGDSWYGIDGQNVIKIGCNPWRVESLNGGEGRFFRTDDKYKKIISEISRDRTVRSAVKKFPGLRLLQQDPFQCYISFIVSSNSSIQNIRNSLQNICKKFGTKVQYQDKKFFVFPTPEKLSKATIHELRRCGLGYRAEYVKGATKDVINGKIDFEFLRKSDYNTAKNILMDVFGIGNKVADCILLFSLDKLEAFPLDRWTLRILEKYYPEKFSWNGKTLSQKKYEESHERIVECFGPYAGYAQQFLFKMERDLYQKKWL